jgi:hypothetical protein
VPDNTYMSVFHVEESLTLLISTGATQAESRTFEVTADPKIMLVANTYILSCSLPCF